MERVLDDYLNAEPVLSANCDHNNNSGGSYSCYYFITSLAFRKYAERSSTDLLVAEGAVTWAYTDGHRAVESESFASRRNLTNVTVAELAL